MEKLTRHSSDGFRIYEARGQLAGSRLSTLLFICILVLPMLATLLYGGVDTFSLGLLSLAVAGMFCIWIAEAWRIGEFRFNANALQLPVAALILIGLIQLLPIGDSGVPNGTLSISAIDALSLDPFATRLFVVRQFAYLLFFSLALIFIDSKTRARRLAFCIVIFGSVLAFFGILQRLADPEAIYGIRATPQAISFGPFVNQHHFAAFMEITAGIVFGLLLGGGLKRDRKPFLLIAAVLMSTALIFTGSRGGVISFAGVLVFTVAATYLFRAGPLARQKVDVGSAARNFALLAGGSALILLIIGLVFYLGGGDSLLRGFGFQQLQTDVSSGRIHYWQVAFEIFKSHPIIGAGLDAFGNAFTRFDTLNGAYRIEQAHNDYLQMLADGGVVGFACVAIFVILLFRDGIRNISIASSELGRSIAIGGLAGCFGIAIHSFFDFPLRTPSNALFFLLTAVLATTNFEAKSD